MGRRANGDITSSSSSNVWEYFEKLENDTAKCLLCKAVLKWPAPSTTGPLRHLTGKY